MGDGHPKAADPVQEESPLQVRHLIARMKTGFLMIKTISILRRSGQGLGEAINGKVRVNNWPRILHVALDPPRRLRKEEMQQGVNIRGVCYEFTGLIHNRGEGVWEVSVKRTIDRVRCWYLLSADHSSKHSNTEDILHEVVLVQLSAKMDDEPQESAQQGVQQVVLRLCFPIIYLVQN